MSVLEEKLIAKIKCHLDRDETYDYIAHRYNRMMLTRHSGLPKRLGQVEKEVVDTARAVENFVKFISAGNYSEAVAGGLQESEVKLALLREEERSLRSQVQNQIYTTPMAIRKRFEDLEGILGQKVAEANRRLRALLPNKVTLTPQVVENKTVWNLKGSLNLYSLVRFDSVKNGVPEVSMIEPIQTPLELVV